MRGMLMPAVRMAVSSLLAESRPKTSSTAVRNPHGMLKVSETAESTR